MSGALKTAIPPSDLVAREPSAFAIECRGNAREKRRAKVFLGSVAESVTKEAPCPVITVPPQAVTT
ncbi:MAG: universal stress protein [Deltaproteobacteria bacterium]|nr:universal stress protein [Deltaproteobacteria bacterium]